ncbi:hypothetical protein D3C84_1066820 [compost metagenome]
MKTITDHVLSDSSWDNGLIADIRSRSIACTTPPATAAKMPDTPKCSAIIYSANGVKR